MSHRFNDRNISGLAEVLEFLKKDQVALLSGSSAQQNEQFRVVWYRGLPGSSLSLLPTLHRNNIPVADEGHLMNRFKQNVHQFLPERPQGEWEWMLLARHHGLPSRLLDWTENPLVGLFFACGGYNSDYSESDGALWCLLPGELNQIASRGTVRWSNSLPMFLDEHELSEQDEFLTNYKPSRLRNLTSEKPVPPAAAMSIRTTQRIQAQQGVFTIHHADKTPLEEWEEGSCLWKFVIPKDRKASLCAEIERLGVTELTLFPDPDKVAQEARRGYSYGQI